LGIDYLSTCEITESHKEGLLTAIEGASKQFEIVNSLKELPFTEVVRIIEVLPMGLLNACATFQRLIDEVMKDFIVEICFVYLDDVVVFSENEKEHF
jgi:hypothetical protein